MNDVTITLTAEDAAWDRLLDGLVAEANICKHELWGKSAYDLARQIERARAGGVE